MDESVQITIDAAVLSRAVDAFIERMQVLVAEQAESLAIRLRDEMLKSICVEFEGQRVRLTIRPAPETEIIQ